MIILLHILSHHGKPAKVERDVGAAKNTTFVTWRFNGIRT